MTRSFFTRAPAQIIILLFLVSLAYINIFWNGFVFDDLNFILGWREVIQGDVTAILQGATPAGQGGIYRPWRGLFYIISYRLFAGNVFYYHLQSLFLILSITILVYLISRIIFKMNWPAFISALLFGLHPVHVEAITFMTASFDTIGLLFFFLSFYLYLKSKTDIFRKKLDFYLLSIVSAAVAFFTYEMTLVLIPMLILYDLCFEKERFVRKFKKLAQVFRRYIPYIALCLVYILIRVVIQQITGRADQYLAGSFYLTQLVTSRIITLYWQLLLLPVNLAINHTILPGINSAFWAEGNNQSVITLSIFTPKILLSVISIIAVSLVAILAYKKRPFLTFIIGWFFIGISPVMNFIPQGTLMGERYLIISSFSFSLLSAYLFTKLYKFKLFHIPLTVLFITVVIFYIGATVLRNGQWKTEALLWRHDVEVSPNSAFNRYALANSYAQKKQYQQALIEAQKAVSLAPYRADEWSLLGRIYMNLNQNHLAIEAFKQGLAIDPNYFYLYRHLGSVLERQGKLDDALLVYQQGVEISNGLDALSLTGLGNVYRQQGKIDQAITAYQKATEANPYFATPHLMLSNLYHQQGNKDMATEEYQKVLKLNK